MRLLIQHSRLIYDSCSSGQHFACGFLQTAPHETALAVRLMVPATGPIGDFNPQASVPCRAHTWKSVDFVNTPEEFKPGQRASEADLYLNHLVFEPNGIIAGNYLTWTKGLVISQSEKTASRYIIKKMDGETYMFFEWKSGDYTVRSMKPKYYVLKKMP